jgi:acid stress-induced BolA-like protein IbaG/YrbA
MQASDIERLIKEGLPDAEVIIHGDNGVHFEATVISASFIGKSLVPQHRVVYSALGRRMESQEIHALALKTHTPDGWQNKR